MHRIVDLLFNIYFDLLLELHLATYIKYDNEEVIYPLLEHRIYLLIIF